MQVDFYLSEKEVELIDVYAPLGEQAVSTALAKIVSQAFEPLIGMSYIAGVSGAMLYPDSHEVQIQFRTQFRYC